MRLFACRSASCQNSARLAVVVGEQFGAHAQLVAALVGVGRACDAVTNPVAGHSRGRPLRLLRRGCSARSWRGPSGHASASGRRAGNCANGHFGALIGIWWKLAVPSRDFLRVEIGEQPPLQQRIVGEIDARHDIGRAEGHLLGLGEEIVRVAVQHHRARPCRTRHDLLGDQLGRVEHVIGLRVRRMPGRTPARPAPIPGRRRWRSPRAGRGGGSRCRRPAASAPRPTRVDCMPSFGFQWNLTKVTLPLALTSWKVWMPKPFDHAQRARDGAVGHRPHQHVRGLRHQRRQVPERVVGAAGLRIAAVGLHLHGVDQIGELDRVLDEEHRDVVADQIPVAFLWCRTSPRSRARRAAYRPNRRRRRRSRSARTPASSRPRAGTDPALVMSARESVHSK